MKHYQKEKMKTFNDIIGRVIYWKVYRRTDIKTTNWYGYVYRPFERIVDERTKKIIKSGIYQFNTGMSYKHEAEKAVRVYLRNSENIPVEIVENTMGEILIEYLKSYNQRKENEFSKGQINDYRKTKSIQGMNSKIKILINFFKAYTVKSVTPEIIDLYIIERQKLCKDGTIKGEITKLVAAINMKLNYTKSSNSLNSQLQDVLKSVRNSNLRKNLAPNKKNGFFQWIEFEALKENSPVWLRDLITYLYYTGCRIGEAQFLTWANVNIKEGYVLLERSETKEKFEKKVFLPKVLVQLLEKIYNDKSEYVFQGPNGKRISNTRLYKAWKIAMRDADLLNDKGDVKFTPHCFRRTFVRNAIDLADMETVKMFTGHRTDNMLHYYNIRTEQDSKNLAEGLDKIEDREKEKIKKLYDKIWHSE